jgi:C4-dicarboxylate transporter DctM subunit
VTIPIFFPLIVSLGFDPVWFGIVFTVNTQLGLITPPLGIDLFAVTNVFKIPTRDLLRGVAPFFTILLIFLVIIIAFPQLSLWLPSQMLGK